MGQLEQQALGRQRKSLLSLSGPPQVSASTQRDGGAKRHQFTNKGATSTATKETYVIELTPEPQLTLTCQALLISFVNSLCCLPNWGLSQSHVGFLFTRANAWTHSQNRHFSWTDILVCLMFPKMRIIYTRRPPPEQLPCYRWSPVTSIDILIFFSANKTFKPC